MVSDRHKIEEVLRYGEVVLSQRSDLRDIPFSEMIDTLEDGTQEMTHNRWGILAQAIISSISNWEIKALVEYLGEIDCPPIAYEYVGYALQSTHGVVLEEMLIEAAGCKSFDTIAKYVSSNLQYRYLSRFIFQQICFRKKLPSFLFPNIYMKKMKETKVRNSILRQIRIRTFSNSPKSSPMSTYIVKN